MQILAAFAAGLIFGLGLIISQMFNPAKVLAFLDVTGRWDPSLAFVMAGAIAVSGLGYLVARRRGAPILAAELQIPKRGALDARLVVGAAIFGVGWGLAGLCPGPAVLALTLGGSKAFVFFAAMLVGMAAFALLPSEAKPRSRSRIEEADA